jgi:hypothetical protein
MLNWLERNRLRVNGIRLLAIPSGHLSMWLWGHRARAASLRVIIAIVTAPIST